LAASRSHRFDARFTSANPGCDQSQEPRGLVEGRK
jgi:hypothetical protein